MYLFSINSKSTYNTIKYTILFAALAATTHFTTASSIQPRDDRPAFWFKLDPEEFKKDESLAVTIRGGTNVSDTEAERSITGAAELHLAKISLAGQVAFLGDLVFERPTDKPRNTTVTLVHEHKTKVIQGESGAFLSHVYSLITPSCSAALHFRNNPLSLRCRGSRTSG
jgi:hypothetical protein